MINKLTIELEVLPIDKLELTDKSQWIWARDLTNNWGEWERIRVWRESYFGSVKDLWSTNSSDIAYTNVGRPPYTHYITLPDISFSNR